MSTIVSPQRTPSAFVPPPGGVWTEGPLVCMLRDAELPPYCFKCGDVADGGPVRRRVNTDLDPEIDPAIMLLKMLFHTTWASVRIPLCAYHQRQRRMRGTLAAGGYALGIAGELLASVCRLHDKPRLALMLVGAGVAIAVPAAIFILGSELFATFIDEKVIKLGGAGNAFLARFPAFCPPGMVPVYWHAPPATQRAPSGKGFIAS